MRWDGLFADLESQADALAVAERAGEIEDRTRSETAKLTMVARLRGCVGLPLRVACRSNMALSGTLLQVHPEWLLLSQANGRESVVASAHVLSVAGLGRAVQQESGSVVDARLGLRLALRQIARDRSGVRLNLVEGELSGTIDRVGADFLELAIHPPGEARRGSAVSEVRLVAIVAIVAISRDAD